MALLGSSLLVGSASARQISPGSVTPRVSVIKATEDATVTPTPDNATPKTTPFKNGRGLLKELPDLSKYEDMTDEQRQEAMKADLKTILDAKVKAGDLTQEQADKMLERFTDCTKGGLLFRKFDGGLTLRDENGNAVEIKLPDPSDSKYADMTDEQRQEAMKADLKTALDALVKDGKLTQEQADKFLTGFAEGPRPGRHFGKGRLGGQITLRDEDGNTVEIKLPDPSDSKYADMTDEQRQEAMKADLKTALDALVKDGKLTQEQADKMLAQFGTRPDGGFRCKGGMGGHRGGTQNNTESGRSTVPASGTKGSIKTI